jgi:hypothetical protein
VPLEAGPPVPSRHVYICSTDFLFTVFHHCLVELSGRGASEKADDTASRTPIVRDPEDLPALYQSANRQSLDAQRSFFTWLKLRLGGIFVAAVGGAVPFPLAIGPLKVGGVIAFVAFAVALGSELVLAIGRPERIWYEGRAAAESAKTLAWRYMVHGKTFEASVQDPDRKLLDKLNDVLNELDALPVHAISGHDVQITAAMRTVRALPYNERREVYLRERVQTQQSWYAGKAARNALLANRWIVLTIALEFLGLVGGGLKAIGLVEIDLLGIFAAGAAAATAWVQAKQHQNLATAYGVTSQELAAVTSEVEALTDQALWGQLVAAAEEAISREHTLWTASRGIMVRGRR